MLKQAKGPPQTARLQSEIHIKLAARNVSSITAYLTESALSKGRNRNAARMSLLRNGSLYPIERSPLLFFGLWEVGRALLLLCSKACLKGDFSRCVQTFTQIVPESMAQQNMRGASWRER